MPVPDFDRLLSAGDVADRLDVSTHTLAGWRRRGVGPDYVKFHGGTIRYRVSAVEAYLDSLTVAGGAV